MALGRLDMRTSFDIFAAAPFPLRTPCALRPLAWQFPTNHPGFCPRTRPSPTPHEVRRRVKSPQPAAGPGPADVQERAGGCGRRICPGRGKSGCARATTFSRGPQGGGPNSPTPSRKKCFRCSRVMQSAVGTWTPPSARRRAAEARSCLRGTPPHRSRYRTGPGRARVLARRGPARGPQPRTPVRAACLPRRIHTTALQASDRVMSPRASGRAMPPQLQQHTKGWFHDQPLAQPSPVRPHHGRESPSCIRPVSLALRTCVAPAQCANMSEKRI